MSAVDLNDQEWGQLMGILADAPWKIANPLLMKIGDQLRAYHTQIRAPTPEEMRVGGNSQEAPNGQ
jgi:hypothetical protein